MIQFLESRFSFYQKNSFTRVSRFFVRNIEKLFIGGIRVKGSGRLQGEAMASKYQYEVGNLPNSYVTSKLNYKQGTVKTKYGTCSIKLWIYYNRI